MPFYCRERELNKMQTRYDRGTWECIVIYGRRRVGKTALITTFCHNKPVIYFSALNASAQENLDVLSKAICNYHFPEEEIYPVFKNFDAAFQEIGRIAEKEQIIFVIDEYPYLAKAEPSVSSRLQHLIDLKWQNSQMFLILCGSSMSFMQHQVLGYESPLYGRRTAQFKIEPLTYRETAVFNPQWTDEEKAVVYGVTGGIPHYINQLIGETSVDQALLTAVFDPSGYLFEEPENLLKQELREPGIYNSIITAIAFGAVKINEIASKVGIESGPCAKYIKILIELGILKKETPISEKPGKKTIYLIEDNFFRFWYRFIPKNLSLIAAGRFDMAYDRLIKQKMHDYMGLIFEKMCKEYLMRYAQDLPFDLAEVGQWWGNDPIQKKQIQIDIIGLPVQDANTTFDAFLIGSCKFRNEKTGLDELHLMQHYAEVFAKGKKAYIFIFSLGGFTEALKEQAKENPVRLIGLEDMYAANSSDFS